MERTGKNYDKLTIIDDFMFGKVMRNPKYCKNVEEELYNLYL